MRIYSSVYFVHFEKLWWLDPIIAHHDIISVEVLAGFYGFLIFRLNPIY